MKTTIRRLTATLALALAFAVPALAAPVEAPTSIGLADHLFAWLGDLWDRVAGNEEIGSGLDPDGSRGDIGSGLDPDGAQQEVGSGIDPSGIRMDTNIGSGMDPNG